MKPGVRLTNHAVERYLQRYPYEGTAEEATRELEELAAQAVPTRERANRGFIYTANGVRFVVHYDTHNRREAPICATILPPVDNTPFDMSELADQYG